jgi:hypothetical protein
VDVQSENKLLDATHAMSADANGVSSMRQLRFVEEVNIQFGFLRDMGFTRVHCEDTIVQFQSSMVGVTIYHGRQSYEIGLEITFPSSKDRFPISAILLLIDPIQADEYRNPAGTTVESVAVGVRGLAELFRKCIDSGVLCDDRVLSRLETLCSERIRKFSLDVELRQAHRKCESAWAEKDLAKVVQILSPLREHLATGDLRRLEYAEKRRNE